MIKCHLRLDNSMSLVLDRAAYAPGVQPMTNPNHGIDPELTYRHGDMAHHVAVDSIVQILIVQMSRSSKL